MRFVITSGGGPTGIEASGNGDVEAGKGGRSGLAAATVELGRLGGLGECASGSVCWSESTGMISGLEGSSVDLVSSVSHTETLVSVS